MEEKSHISKQCIKSLSKGDVQAFNEVYNAFKFRIYGFVKKIVKADVDTEGIIQEVFIKLWEKHSTIDSEKSLDAFLFKIAYNMSIDLLRMRSHEKKYLDSLYNSDISTSLDTEKMVN